MQPTGSSEANQPAQNRKARRRKVADDIQEQQPEGVKSLLAALEKAQKGKTDPPQKETLAKTQKQETKKQTVGARVARSRQESGSQQAPSTRTNPSNSTSAGPSKYYNANTKINKPLPQKVRIPSDVLDDLIFRFIEHVPLHEKFVNTRVCFQVELAHWFYVDYYVNKEMSCRTDCPNMMMRESIFSHSPEHKHMARNVDEVLDEWRYYKSNVPTYGAILLDSTLSKVVLVQGFYSSKNSWGFPKGKVNEDEDPRDCAAREVYEETGYDFKDEANRPQMSKEFKIQKFVNDTMVRLYVITDVSMDFKFAPKTRNEIRDIQWFNVSDLPTDKNDQRNGPLSNNNFYTVIPFVQDLQIYIKKELQRRAKTKMQMPPTQQSSKIIPAEMLAGFSQVNVMTPMKSENTSNVLSNLFNSFLPGNKQDHSLKDAPFSSPALNNLSSLPKAPIPAQHQLISSNIASANSAFSPFKPLEENIAQSLLNIVKPQMTQNVHLVAHPIPIPGIPKLTPLQQNAPVQRPTPPKPKIGASETSAFKAIPKNKSSNSLNDSDSIFGSEVALDLCGVKDSVSSATTAYDLNNFNVQLCDAWKSFKLDVGAILDNSTSIFYR